MSVGGFLVTPTVLNVFWRDIFHYIDYQVFLPSFLLNLPSPIKHPTDPILKKQTYVFQLMMVNEFQSRTYSCDANCNCMYSTPLESSCQISGKGVLEQYGYRTDRTGLWVGILVAIIAAYRILGWIALALRK